MADKQAGGGFYQEVIITILIYQEVDSIRRSILVFGRANFKKPNYQVCRKYSSDLYLTFLDLFMVLNIATIFDDQVCVFKSDVSPDRI